MTAGGPRFPLVAVYADESCLGNGKEGDNPGGAGALLEYARPDGGGIVRRDLWIFEPGTTNNRMALRSAIESLRALARKGQRFSVVFTTDSRYLCDGMREWIFGWARRGWTRKGGAIENLPLWFDAVEAALRASDTVTAAFDPSGRPEEPPPAAVMERLKQGLDADANAVVDSATTLKLVEAVRGLAVRHGPVAVEHCTRMVTDLRRLLDGLTGTG